MLPHRLKMRAKPLVTLVFNSVPMQIFVLWQHVHLIPSLLLVILVMTVCPTSSQLESMIKTTVGILGLSGKNASLVLYPQLYSGLQMASLRQVHLTIENRLLHHGADIDMDIMIHCEVVQMNGSEKRPLASRVWLDVSARHGTGSPWKLRNANRGKIQNASASDVAACCAAAANFNCVELLLLVSCDLRLPAMRACWPPPHCAFGVV